MKNKAKAILLFLMLGLLSALNTVSADTDRPAAIALIIDDIGNNPEMGLSALELPGNLMISILPNTPHATILAMLAQEKGKQVMLHLPMESEHQHKLGPNGLMQNMPEPDYKQTVRHALLSVPHVVGLNNHMGSLLTQQVKQMQWLMEELNDKGLFFLDSRTTANTVAQQTASEMGIRTLSRDVFLDNSRDPLDIQAKFEHLLRLAKRKGFATGIAHPYPETLSVLKQQLPGLEARGVKLVFVTDLLSDYVSNDQQMAERSSTWPASSSLSHRVAKNLKQ